MKKAKRFLTCLLCFALVFVMGGGGIFSAFSLTASAAETTFDINTSSPLDDLQGATIEGTPFSTDAFNADTVGVPFILNFLEYRYGSEEFSLYFYLLIPKGTTIWDTTVLSYVSLQFGEADGAEVYKLPARYLTEAEDPVHNGRYLKFKVEPTESQKSLFLSILDENNRTYRTSDFEFRYRYSDGELANPTAVSSAQKYVYSGYMPGCGDASNEESTLKCTIDDMLETVSLNVTPTYYRTATSEKGQGYQKQLDSVFFSVPSRLMNTNGKLQRIKAEWYEFKTAPIIVTSNKEFYDAAEDFLGVYLPNTNIWDANYDENIGWSLFSNDLDLDMHSRYSTASWGWNVTNDYCTSYHISRLAYLLPADDLKTYDYTKKYEVAPSVTSNDLLEYMYAYNSESDLPLYPTASGKYVKGDLFEDDIDESRKVNNEAGHIKMGYSYYDFDADVDLQKLRTWSSTDPSFWDNLLEWGFLTALTGGPEEASRECDPIYVVTASDLVGTDLQIAERLMIKVDDVRLLRQEYSNAKFVSDASDEEMEVVLFRFAVSDYYSAPVVLVQEDGSAFWFDKVIQDQAYMAQESVFLNFDIIQLTFRQHGLDTVIPVVMKPIDIVADITPPIVSDPAERMNELLDSILKILGALVFIMVAVLVWNIAKPILKPIFKMLWDGIKTILKWILSILLYPFKLLGRLFRSK